MMTWQRGAVLSVELGVLEAVGCGLLDLVWKGHTDMRRKQNDSNQTNNLDDTLE